ncbi:unnamed protein product [Ranitomeya imitator]|uniref:Uncharacterized protein n=1 Tax=Ranitomeya imitator TaxID=111125 RepID=A0ABN9L7X0_9NEOB|nr:unnamed protein product [Ranitomeya imitator]
MTVTSRRVLLPQHLRNRTAGCSAQEIRTSEGYRHPSPTTVARTVRILHTLLALVNKHRNCDKFEVNTQSVAYLAGSGMHLAASYPTVGQVSPRTRKSMSLDMGQPSQANTKKLLGTRKSFDHLISDTKAPKRQEIESGITTPPKMRRVAENDYDIDTPRISSPQQHPHLRKVSVSESNVLLDEEVLTDPKTQALLLTVLVRLFSFFFDGLFDNSLFHDELHISSGLFYNLEQQLEPA